MILIADSGSTKTTWIFLEGEKIKNTVTTSGLNPYFHTSVSVEAVLKADLAPSLIDFHIREVHFYGAGCSTEYNNRMISDAIRLFLPRARIHVYHDILGAARALFGREAGLACILGTGCNSCYYDGKETFGKIDSLGYLFGDEGAGSYLGKLLLGAYLKKELPPEIRERFDAAYGYSLEDILNALYNKPFPNRFLASFSHFIYPNREDPYLHSMILRSFSDFFRAHVLKYDRYETLSLGFIGSIASVYRDFLEDAAANHGLTVSRVLASPVDGLTGYHSASL